MLHNNWFRSGPRVGSASRRRRCRRALLTLLVPGLVLLLAGSAWAKSPYERHRSTEGDPGDGVLEPVAPPTPETDDRGGIETNEALLPYGGDTPVYRFPLVIFVNGSSSPLFFTFRGSPLEFAPTTVLGPVAVRGW